MITLATPISHLFADAQIAQRIAAASDCLECRDHTVDCALPRQELFHFEVELPHAWTDHQRDFIRNAVRQKTDLRLITFHAASCCSAPVLDGGYYQPGGETYSLEQMMAHAQTNTNWLRSFLPSQITVGIENNNYYPTPAYDHVTDGAFLSAITHENDLAFLFDIAHARITAHNRNISFATYRDSLPLERIIQVHVCRHAVDARGMAVDAHLAPGSAELNDVGAIVKSRSGLRYITIEYYKDSAILLAILREYRNAFV